MLLSKVDRIASKADGAVESLFFSYEEAEKVEKQTDKDDGLVTIDIEKNQLASGLSFSERGQSERRLTFEKDSLALQALQEGKVDFADKRV